MAERVPHQSIDLPSAWVERFAGLIPDGEVLDLACGSGRHARLLAGSGHAVLAVDRDGAALACAAGKNISILQVDLERPAAEFQWPFEPDRFAGIVVTNYLHRPLFPCIFASLARGGVLIYETFALGNERYGKPSNPDFLLAPGELLQVAQHVDEIPMHVVAYEHGYVQVPKPAMIQRICVVKE